MPHQTFGCALLALTILAAPGRAWTDTVKLRDQPAFRGVTITGFQRGRLVFRGQSRQYLRKPLDQVEWAEIDGLDPFNGAERAILDERWSAAIELYRQALPAAAEPWLADLIRVRLLAACERADRFDEAVAVYAELVQLQPDLAHGLAPRHPGPPASEINARARTTLERALAENPPVAASNALRTLLLELLLYEDAAELPAELAPADTSGRAVTSAPAPAPTSGPLSEGFQPLWPESRPARTPPIPASRPALSTSRPTLKLPPGSFVFKAAEQALAAGDAARAVRLLARAGPHIDGADRERWRLLWGRARLETGHAAEAAADLLSLSQAADDAHVAAEALYYVGLAHERIGRADVAGRLYRELAQRSDLPADLRERVAQGLKRVGD